MPVKSWSQLYGGRGEQSISDTPLSHYTFTVPPHYLLAVPAPCLFMPRFLIDMHKNSPVLTRGIINARVFHACLSLVIR